MMPESCNTSTAVLPAAGNDSFVVSEGMRNGKKALFTIDIHRPDLERYDRAAEKMHSVAVVMATYNGERFLKEQLDSLIVQKGVRVNILVRDIYSTVKGINPDIRFGISPMGIIGTLESDYQYYVDIIKWLSSDGYVDYMMLMSCNRFPVFVDISNFLSEHGLLLLFSFFMLGIVYPLVTAIMVSIELGVYKLVDFVREKNGKNKYKKLVN